MTKVLISTIYDHNSVMLCATKYGAERIFLLVDEKPGKEQTESIKKVIDALGGVIDIVQHKCSVYKIVDVAKCVVDIIDDIPESDIININPTPGRKTQSLGLIYGAYARINRINDIIYTVEEDKSIVLLPKLSFEISESQKNILGMLGKKTVKTTSEISEQTGLTKSLVYRNIDVLVQKGMIVKDENGLELTDFGKLVLL